MKRKLKRKPILFKAIEQEQKNINITNIHNKLIMIGNLSKRAGSTFIALNLAKTISKDHKISPCFIELPLDKPYVFDAIGLNIKLQDDEFESYPHLIMNEINDIKGKRLEIIDGIVWLVPDPRRPQIKNWEYKHTMKLIGTAMSNKLNISIIDCGSFLDHESVKPVMDFADLICIVIDPLPAEILQNEDRFIWLRKLKEEGYPIKFIINRFNPGINKKALLDYLKIEVFSVIPAIDTKLVCKAYYDCKIPIEIPEVYNNLYEPLFSIVKKGIIENSYYKIKNHSFLRFGEGE